MHNFSELWYDIKVNILKRKKKDKGMTFSVLRIKLKIIMLEKIKSSSLIFLTIYFIITNTYSYCVARNILKSLQTNN